ncbi:Protein of unknown function [Gryllus bimaculatus]|nr:Protein of unknown function [Gryllus bimaculatus]
MLFAVAAALACALVATAAPPGPASPRDAAARDLFDSVRQLIREGDEALGVPPLDPFRLAFANGSFASDGSYAVAVAVPALRLTSGYSFDGVVKVRGQDVELYGNGPLEVDVKNIDVSVEAVITILTQKIRSITTSIDIGNIEVAVDGLLEGGLVNPFISAVVSELANELFAEQRAALEQAASDALKEPLQAALDSFSLDDLLCLLGLCSESAVMEAMKEAATQVVDGEAYSI